MKAFASVAWTRKGWPLLDTTWLLPRDSSPSSMGDFLFLSPHRPLGVGDTLLFACVMCKKWCVISCGYFNFRFPDC